MCPLVDVVWAKLLRLGTTERLITTNIWKDINISRREEPRFLSAIGEPRPADDMRVIDLMNTCLQQLFLRGCMKTRVGTM